MKNSVIDKEKETKANHRMAKKQIEVQRQRDIEADRTAGKQIEVQQKRDENAHNLALLQFQHNKSEAERAAKVEKEKATNAAFKDALDLKEKARKSPAKAFLCTLIS